ncbi:hypothetical protein LJC58_06745, partial [Lachnospiraceae bacterium OttesenSCG-928-D06]|nr:hypothetical protein [Lachnospiraceae bacterium OttesenSCG-928-D06]
RYNMGEVLVDQLMYYWLWTGDTEFFEQEAYEFVVMHLKYQENYIKVDSANLYENWLNAWNTDNKWNNGGPGSIATAYTWRAYNVMSQIAAALKKEEDARVYKAKADAIKMDMKDVLWDKESGVYGEFRDVFGLKRLNTAPDLSSMYTPIDVGITDELEGYQMLRYSDYAIDSIEIDGYEFKYSANRLPEFYSSYGLYEQETMNNAYAYFKIGYCEMGYKQYMGCVVPMYMGMGAGPGASSHRQDENLENAGHIDFADTSSLYTRTAVEGIFGIRMQQAYDVAEITPGFPKEWEEAAIETKYISYSYQYVDGRDIFKIKTPRRLVYKMKIPVRSSKILGVKVNGEAVDFTVSKYVSFYTDKVDQADVEIEYGKGEVAFISNSKTGAAGSQYIVKTNGVIKNIIDPQEVIVNETIHSGAEVQLVLGEKTGYHTFFAEVEKDDMVAILPVDIEIRNPLEIIDTSIVQGMKPGVNLKIRNNTERVLRIVADISVGNYCVEVEEVLESLGTSSTIFVKTEGLLGLTPGNNKIKAVISGFDIQGIIEGEVTEWKLDTDSAVYITLSLEGMVNQELSKLHNNIYDITFGDNPHFQLPNFYFVRDTPRRATSTGRTWWEDRNRGKNGIPDKLNLPEVGGVYVTDIGVPFQVAAEGKDKANAVFVSLYNQFPDCIDIPVNESGTKVYFMLSISTNNMQSRIENARITIHLSDGSKEILYLVNPDNIDDWLSYQRSDAHDGVCLNAHEPEERELYEHKAYVESGFVQKLSRKAHANILAVDFGEVKDICSIEFKCLSNEVLAGLLGVTIVSDN